MQTKCGECGDFLPSHLKNVFCIICNTYYHIKCCSVRSKRNFIELEIQGSPWICHKCTPPISTKKVKCGGCSKTIPKNSIGIKCKNCKKNFHSKCTNTSLRNFEENWLCDGCLISTLPFSNVNNQRFGLTLQAKNEPNLENLQLFPSFTIRSLLDKIPGKFTIQTDEFLSDSIESKYYTPDEFISSKINKHCFSVFHLNIASLSGHIDDLKALLAIIDHPFNIIGISETKIRDDQDPVSNIQIENYIFEHTPTFSHFGGAGLYIRKGQDYQIRKNLSKSIRSVAESFFIELTLKSTKNMLVGCIYRHHDSVEDFIDNFFLDILHKIHLERNKSCVLMGDFNIDLLQVDNSDSSGLFFDTLSSFGFRPLILQPSRVTSHSATLIDNIFTNDITICSKGGNLTSSISDHFPQFSVFDVPIHTKHKNVPKFGRSYKNFHHDEFQEELMKIDWNSLFSLKNVNDQITIMLDKINGILNVMAPIHKLTKRENKLQWITQGILKSMKNRDKAYKKFTIEKDLAKKHRLFIDYKYKRNLITTLLRRSKADYYASFF